MSKSTEPATLPSAATECTIRVGIVPLRAALLSVVKHADTPKIGDEELTLARVRWLADKDELLIVATNANSDGQTSAMAAVPIEEDDRRVKFEAWDGPLVVDMHPAKVRDLARMLKPIRVGAGEDPHPSNTGWAEVRMRVNGELGSVRVADVSGLWEGQSQTVPALAHRADYPDVPGIVGRALQHASGTFKPLVTTTGILGRFEVAARQYGLELVAEPTGTAESAGWVVYCGPDFAGVVESGLGGGSLGKRDKRKMRHLERAGFAKPQLASI